ncbi:MAG: hypothetical protein A2V76_07865 [Candidatus Aminicenantes bacterium RBG_16_63_14]|nr:MAG: hypothetical protein A2V76_07865 [Candidatus Aminicenantes bacterium RBG_16_63_14]
MTSLNPKQSVEVFHLVLLDQIGRKLDKQTWALKGGCNLRFFFKSPRYSDDMDLDVQGVPVDALRERDVFDLHLLLETGLKPALGLTGKGEADLARIKESVLAVDFGQFKSQVVSYLEPDLQPHYDSEETWDAMRWRIIEALGEGPS